MLFSAAWVSVIKSHLGSLSHKYDPLGLGQKFVHGSESRNDPNSLHW